MDKLKMSEVFGLEVKYVGYVENVAYRWPYEMIDGYNHCIEDLDQWEIDVKALTKCMNDAPMRRQKHGGYIGITNTQMSKYLVDNMHLWIRKKNGQ